MGVRSDRRHSQLKRTWLRILQAGAGSLVIAAAVVSAPPAEAATPPAQPGVEQRVQAAREALLPGPPAGDRGKAAHDQLAWWGNRVGFVGVRPVVAWPNWPNWHNWHNWGNGWGNFGPAGWGNF